MVQPRHPGAALFDREHPLGETALRSALLAALVAILAAGCGEPSCETGEEASCVLPTPCQSISTTACPGFTRISVLGPRSPAPVGDDALSSPGDFLLQNDLVDIVIDGLGNPHHFAPTGGAVLDAVTAGGGGDGLAQISQTINFEAGTGMVYDRYRIIDLDGGKALQVRGTVGGDEDHRVLTRYEIRKCEPGIRVRTEVYNLGAEPIDWHLADVWLHGEGGQRPFAPYPGGGFAHGEGDGPPAGMVEAPFLATAPADGRTASYGCVPCSERRLAAFIHGEASVVGVAPSQVDPGQRAVFERFLIVSPGDDAAGAANIAYELRRDLFGEPFATVRGHATPTGAGAPGEEVRNTILLEEADVARGDAATPFNQVTPDADGAFEARVPAGVDVDVVSLAFGREVGRATLSGGDGELDAGDVAGGAAGTIRVTTTLDDAAGEVQVTVIPADRETRDAVLARRLEGKETCAPLLAQPSDSAAACNRAVVTGTAELTVPPGTYRVVATHGPFSTLDAQVVEVEASGTADAALSVHSLDLADQLGPGALSLDLSTHGAASYDARGDDEGRVRSFLAAGLDLVAVTDHDVLADYQGAVDAVGAGDRLRVLTGLETTGQQPFAFRGDGVATTVGRLGFLPLQSVATGPWRGAPQDEGVEPGALITRVASTGFEVDTGLIQLLRPFGRPVLHRDVGFLRAIGLGTTAPVPTLPPALSRTPPAARHANDAFHTIEVISGAEPEAFVAQRVAWHYLLASNVVRPVTGGSGSHGIGGAVPGSPRTVVAAASADLEDVLTAVRTGRGLATNGPMIEVSLTDDAGGVHRPSVTAIPAPAVAQLSLRVTAAPWVPVDEVRIIINGVVLRTLRDELTHPADPLGMEAVVRFEGLVDIQEGLGFEFNDAFVVVEAGTALPGAGDLDCDGVPDTGDNDGDGDVDEADVGIRAAADTPAPPVTVVAPLCVAETGPLRPAPTSSTPDDPSHIFAEVMGFAPTATTNALLLDLDGGGYGGSSFPSTR